jgi:hypothetical protein
MESNLLLIAQTGFILLTVLFSYLLILELWKGIQRTAWSALRKTRVINLISGSLILWHLIVAGWAASGTMSDFSIFPLNFIPIVAIPLVVILAITFFSKSLKEILNHIPAENLVRLQGFRILVELLLWALFAASVLPRQMSFEGRNFDVLSGISALIIAWLITHKRIGRAGLIIWNIAGLALLINIVAIAVLSTPSPWRIFMEEPSNTIVTYFPICWLPGFLVPLAYTLHFFSLKKTLSTPSIPRPATERV